MTTGSFNCSSGGGSGSPRSSNNSLLIQSRYQSVRSFSNSSSWTRRSTPRNQSGQFTISRELLPATTEKNTKNLSASRTLYGPIPSSLPEPLSGTWPSFRNDSIQSFQSKRARVPQDVGADSFLSNRFSCVIYTGVETRSMMNNNQSRSKIGLLDDEINSLTKVRPARAPVLTTLSRHS